MATRRRLLAWAICCAWLGVCLPGAGAAEAELLSSPERDVSDDLLRQALVSEIKGDANERTQRLEEALAILPDEKLTNWLLGQVLVDGKWQSVEQLQRTQANDPRLAEYRHRREALNGKHRPELELTRWCAEVKWDDLAKLHYARLLAYPDANDAARGEARRALDLQERNGEYYTTAELEEIALEAKARQTAFDLWRPKIVAWRKALSSKNAEHRDRALEELRAIDDPQAIAAIEASLYDSSEAFAAELINLLGKFPEFEATQALLRFALLTPASQLAQASVAKLKSRPIHDYYPQLLVLMQAPLQSQFRIVEGPDGVIRYEHLIAQQGPQRNAVAVRDTVIRPTVTVTDERGRVTNVLDARLLRQNGRNRLQSTAESEIAKLTSFLTALSAQQRVRVANASINLANERVFYILENTSPQPQPRNPASWWDWWKQYQEKWTPTQTQYVYQRLNQSYRQYSPVIAQVRQSGFSCFVAGTPVWTESGRQPIEKLRPGDRVLSSDVETGELQFKLVIAKTLQAPSPLVKLRIGDEEIVATKSHPFWVSGKGWKMAKELVVGDVLHTLFGPQRLTEAAALPAPREAHNLVVQDFGTYFVGNYAALVHDVAYWQPTTTIVPGMRAAK